MGEENLLLKWGTLKGWKVTTEASNVALQAYLNAGEQSLGAMSQHDTAEQKQALCNLIDAIDGLIQNDWTGEAMTKAEAKNYVLTY